MRRIALHSVPRSGSSWVGEILNSNEKVLYKFQPLFSYSLKGRLNEKSSNQEIDKFFQDLSVTQDDFIDQIDKRKEGKLPAFIKETPYEFIVYKEVRYHHILRNLLQQDKSIKVIGLVRNPLSVVSSWLKAPKEFRKNLGWNELEEWRFAPKKNNGKIEEFNGYEKWKEVAALFDELLLEFPNRFYLLKYDDLLSDPIKIVKKMFNFCNINFTSQTNNFLTKNFNNKTTNEAYSVYNYKQKDDTWKENLDPEIKKLIYQDLERLSLNKYLPLPENK